ncbi:hypothetical protein [Altererythrobacter fulvus]|uniref:hypothetical protein n=1 Tax=Caenibius fulvus TaxID=2126012 RepID=UPI003016AA3D
MAKAPAVAPEGEALPWNWIGAIAALAAAFAAALGAGIWFWRRESPRRAVRAPEIQRPDLAAAAAARPAPPQEPAAEDGAQAWPEEPEEEEAALSLALEARELVITLTAATLSYRVTLTNMSGEVMEGLRVMGDMISAHASLPEEEQLATSDSDPVPQHVIERLRPGESAQINGEFRLNFPLIRPIRKGSALLFVPLARLKVEAASGGNGAVVRTALVGQRSPRPGAGLQPFRLDMGPRIYREVTQRIF